MVFSAALRVGWIARVPCLPLRAQIHIDCGKQAFKLLMREAQIVFERGVGFAGGARHAHLFQLHIQFEDFFEQVGRNAGRVCLPFAIFAGVFFANLRAFELEQVFGAEDGIFQGAVGVVEQRCVGKAPLALILARAREAIGMHFAAEAMELALERVKIYLKAALQAEHLKVVALGRRLNLGAMRTEERGVVVGDRARPASDWHRGIDCLEHIFKLVRRRGLGYEEKDEPQPQEREELGLIKLKP